MEAIITENTPTELIPPAALPEPESEQKLADEIAQLWAVHTDAQTVVKKTKAELQIIRQRLAESLTCFIRERL